MHSTQQNSINFLIFRRSKPFSLNIHTITQNIFRKMINLFWLSLLLAVGSCIDFHLKSTLQSTLLSANVSSITALKDSNTIAVLTGSPTDWQVNIVSLPTFTSLNKTSGANSLALPIITDEQIITNYGDQVRTEQIMTLIKVSTPSNGASKLAITPNLVMVPVSKDCPAVSQIRNYETNAYWGVKEFQTGAACKFNNIGFAENLGNGLLSYATKFNIYILSEDKLDIVQKMVQTGPFKRNGFIYSSSYSKNNEATLLLQGQINHYFAYSRNPTTGTFSKASQFNNPTNQITMTDINEGVSFDQTKLYHWSNIKDHVKGMEYEDQGQFLGELRRPIAVTTNQSMLILFDWNSTQLQFYTFSPQTYKIKYAFSSPIQSGLSIPAHSGSLTTDDKILIGRYRVTYNETKSIFLYNLQTKQWSTLNDYRDKSNCTDYALLNNNCFVVICNATNITYQIQLWSLPGISLVSTYDLDETLDREIKVVSGLDWNGYFVVLYRSKNVMDDNCTATMYRADGGTITATGATSEFVSWNNVYAVGHYLASMKNIRTSEWQYDDSFLKIFDLNLEIVYKEFYIGGFLQGQFNILASGSLLIVQSMPEIGNHEGNIYDLSLQKQDWFIGKYFRLYARGDSCDWLILPKLGYIYYYGFYRSSVYGIVVDLKNPPVESVVRMMEENYKADAYLYIKASQIKQTQAQKGPQCGLAFFVINTTLYKYKDCTQEPLDKLELDPSKKYTKFGSIKLSFASDREHMMIVWQDDNGKRTIEVRALNRLGEVLWSGYEVFTPVPWFDLGPTGTIVYSVYGLVKIIKYHPVQKPADYSISRIIHINTNPKGCLLFSGPVSDSQNTTRIIYKTSERSTHYISVDVVGSQIKLLALHPNCTYFGTYQQDSVATIWKILEQEGEAENRTSYEIEGVQSMMFSVKKEIIFETSTKIIVKDFSKYASQEQKQQDNTKSELLSSNGIKYAISRDGQLLAMTPKPNLVQIKHLSDQSIIAQLTTKESSTITSLTFTPNNTLYISTAANELYVLDPSPCPPNYTALNLQCTCPPSFDNTDNLCICGKGYIDPTTHQCLECSFPCSTCADSATNCDSYATGFYLLIVGGVVVLLGGIGAGVFCWLRKRRTRSEEVSKSNNLLTDGSASLGID